MCRAFGFTEVDQIGRGNKAVMYRIANPASPVRLRAAPPQVIVISPSHGAFLFHNTVLSFGLSGEIGRHSGLKIRRFVNNGRTGSIPVSGTTLTALSCYGRFLENWVR